MDGRMSSSPSFDASLRADLDMLQTPPDRTGGPRPFGARNRSADVRHGAHSSISNGTTAAFLNGSAKAHGRRQRWDVDDAFNFDSGDDHDKHQRQQQHRHEQHHDTYRREHDSDARDHRRDPQQQQQHAHASPNPKYGKPRASGMTITPGASLNYSSDAHLKHTYLPPKKASSFIESVLGTSRKAAASKSAASPKRPPMRMRATTGALELSSAPVATSSGNSTSRSSEQQPAATAPTLGWQPRKERITETPVRSQKARIALRPAPREPTRSSPRQHPPSSFVTTRQSAMLPKRNRDVQLSLETRKSIAESVMRRTTRATKAPTDGTADQPIHLDTDSDHDAPPPPKRVARAAAPASELTKRPLKARAARLKPAHWRDVDVDAISRDPVVELSGMVVWLGRLRCCADVYLRHDCLWISSIRSTLVKWTRMPHLKLSIKGCKSVHVYKYTDDKAPIADSGLEPDERLMAKTSFAALDTPCAYDVDADALRAFYDPLSDDAAKKFVVIEAPEYDCHGLGFDPLADFFRENHPELLEMIPDVATGKQFLHALVSAPYNDDSDDAESGTKSEDDAAAAAASTDATETPRRTRHGRETPRSSALGASEGDDSDCFDVQLTYPLPPCSSDIVTITRHDVSCLRPEQYLNDNIIDYYFKRLMLEDYADNAFIQKNVLFLNSHFYSRLRVGKGTSVAERLRAGYQNVATWVARTDFFSRHLIFIPINKDMHWSLAVIVNPRSASVESPSEDQPPSCIAVLDPLGNYHNKQAIVRNLRSFLQLEWESTHSSAAADTSAGQDDAASPGASAKRRRRPRANLTYDPDRVALVRVKAPQQQNSYDCGVYVLKFAEVMIANYGLFRAMFDDSGPIAKEVVDSRLESLLSPSCISPDDITKTRARIQDAILHDTHKYHQALAHEQSKGTEASEDAGAGAAKQPDAAVVSDTAKDRGDGRGGEGAGDVQTSVQTDESARENSEAKDTKAEAEEMKDDADEEARDRPEPMDQDDV